MTVYALLLELLVCSNGGPYCVISRRLGLTRSLY